MIKKALYDLETRERIFSDMDDAKESQKQHQEAHVKVIKDIVGDNKNRIKNFNQAQDMKLIESLNARDRQMVLAQARRQA